MLTRRWSGRYVLAGMIVAAMLAACARMDDEAPRAALRAADVADINNLMSLHSWYHAAMQNDVELEKIWSKRPDVIWAQQTGYFKGMDSIRKYYGQKATPEVTEGGFVWHTITSPVVVVADDRQTAKGVWYTPGVGGKLNKDGSGNAGWMWEKYGVDFVREEGQWKIWHMRVYTDFSVPVGGRMGEGGGMGAPPPQPSWDHTYQHPYEAWAPGVSPKLVPRPPEPYRTFSETWSYADEGE